MPRLAGVLRFAQDDPKNTLRSLRSEELRHALFEHMNAIADAEAARTAEQPLYGFVYRLLRELEGPVMHGDHVLRAHLDKPTQCVFRAGVHGAEILRVVGPDGHQGNFRVEAAADLR